MDIEGSEHFALAGMPRLLRARTTLVVQFMPQHLSAVRGVSALEFAQPLLRFDAMRVSAQGLAVAGDDIVATLGAMVARGESNAGPIFSRRPGR